MNLLALCWMQETAANMTVSEQMFFPIRELSTYQAAMKIHCGRPRTVRFASGLQVDHQGQGDKPRSHVPWLHAFFFVGRRLCQHTSGELSSSAMALVRAWCRPHSFLLRGPGCMKTSQVFHVELLDKEGLTRALGGFYSSLACVSKGGEIRASFFNEAAEKLYDLMEARFWLRVRRLSSHRPLRHRSELDSRWASASR